MAPCFAAASIWPTRREGRYWAAAVCSTTCGAATTAGCAVEPIQTILGPDGQKYTVYTYIILVQPSSGEYTKQVTVVVRDPRNTAKILARESAVFDPAAAS